MELTELENLSSSEIDDKICELESQHKKMIENQEIVEQKRLAFQKQIIELQLKKKELEIHRLLRPQAAVVVEHCDALSGWHEIGRLLIRNLRHEFND